MNSRLDALKREIEEAFADVPYPGDDRIIDHPDWEAEELLECFRGKHWKDLTHEDLFQNSLTFVDLDAYTFYLPAYLFAALDDYPRADHVVYGLCPTSPEKDAELFQWELRRYDRLDARQRQAVRHFLEYMRDEKRGYLLDAPEVRDALERYWARTDSSDGGGGR
jgi:hypothetical protein